VCDGSWLVLSRSPERTVPPPPIELIFGIVLSFEQQGSPLLELPCSLSGLSVRIAVQCSVVLTVPAAANRCSSPRSSTDRMQSRRHTHRSDHERNGETTD